MTRVSARTRGVSHALHFLILVFATGLAAAMMLGAIIDEIRMTAPLVVITFGINLTVSLMAFSWSAAKDAISLRVMFWFFNLLFFAVVPLAAYVTQTWEYAVSDDSVLTANLLILTSHAVYLATYTRGMASKRQLEQIMAVRGHRRLLSTSRLAFLGVVGAISIAALIANVGFSLLGSVVRRAFEDSYSPLAMLVEYTVRPVSFFVFLFAVLNFRLGHRRWASKVTVAITFLVAFTVLGPFSGSRFLIFSFYFALLVLCVPPTPGRRYLYTSILVGALTGSFLHNALGNWIIGSEEGVAVVTARQYVFQGHFDAFENFCHAIAYVSEEGIVWGRQALGAVLFWVPRGVWPDKPIGSAAFVALSYLSPLYGFVEDTNIASPLIEEAYLNLHVPGVVMAFAIMGFASGRADSVFRKGLERLRGLQAAEALSLTHLAPGLVMYSVSLGLSLFILRGDFLSGVAYSTGIGVSFFLVRALVRRRTVGLKRSLFVAPDSGESPRTDAALDA